jgi:hypothetical protein
LKIGVTGHQSIPPTVLGYVQRRLEEIVSRFERPITGISSLAAGADQLFADVVRRNGGALRVVVPCRGYESTFEHELDRQRYLSLLEQAAAVEILNHAAPTEEAFLDAGQRVARLSTLLIAIWDGQPAKGMGGTSDIVLYARGIRLPIEVVWPSEVRR